MENELMIISGYPRMIDNIQAVCGELDVHPLILEWQSAIPAFFERLNAFMADNGKPDVIICRGALAHMVAHNYGDIVVVRAEPDDIDLVETLQQAKRFGKRAGVLLYAQYGYEFKTAVLETAVGLDELRVYPYFSRSDIEAHIARAQKDGMDFAVGGGMLGQNISRATGYPVVFLETGKRSIQNAILQAIEVIEARRAEKRTLYSLKTVMSSVQEGIMTLGGGSISLVNEVLVSILQTEAETLQGRSPEALSPGVIPPKLLAFLQSDRDEAIIRIGSQQYLTRQISLSATGSQDKTMVIFRDITDIQKQEQKIRRELHTRGLVARFRFADIIGESALLREAIERANIFAETDANILIQGESGTGKELFAQSIHNASSRRRQPFVAVNCAAIPEALLESELFGYEEGAFTGAKRGGKAGLFELAHGGTIFLDEINSLPIGLQGVLLRVIQEKEIRRVGSGHVISINVRIISATNADILGQIGEKRFRADLYYRLNTLHLGLPPLSSRREDIPLLTEHFLRLFGHRYAKSPPPLSRSELALLTDKEWNGNVRELENAIHRYVILNGGGARRPLEFCLDCPGAVAPQPAPVPAQAAKVAATLEASEKEAILKALNDCRWNRTAAAARLGIGRATLWRKLKVLSQEDPRFQMTEEQEEA